VSSAVPQWSYADFAGHVRRFNQESVLDAVAAALARPRRLGEGSRRYIRTPPWALAEVVKASPCNGNPHRSMAMRERDLVLACHKHNNLHPEELDHAELGSPLAVMVRIGYEQFPYQESIFEERWRGRRHSSTATQATDRDHEGSACGDARRPVRDTAGVALLLHVGAEKNGGLFDPKWLEPTEPHRARARGSRSSGRSCSSPSRMVSSRPPAFGRTCTS
jgi:hypothetical protein